MSEVTLAQLASLNQSMPINIPSSQPSPAAATPMSDDSDSENENPLQKLSEQDFDLWKKYLDSMGRDCKLEDMKVAEINEKHKKIEEEVIRAGGTQAVENVRKLKQFLPILKKLKAQQTKAIREAQKEKRERKRARKEGRKKATKGFTFKPSLDMGGGSNEVVVIPLAAWQNLMKLVRVSKL